MKTNRILVNITNLEHVKLYEEVGITNFLFPLKGYSIGYESFTLEDIEKVKNDVYILVNRILTDRDIDNFLKLKMPSNVKGLFIEDIGLYYALRGSRLELINFQNHLNNNFKTINYWLKYFDSLVLSTDISYEEASKIIKEVNKPLVVYAFGFPEIMYSRRHLLTNYYAFTKNESKTKDTLTIPNNEASLVLKENEYGTAVFSNKILDARSEVSKYPQEKVKFYLFDENIIEFSVVIKALKNETLEGVDKGFLYKKTVYRIGDIK